MYLCIFLYANGTWNIGLGILCLVCLNCCIKTPLYFTKTIKNREYCVFRREEAALNHILIETDEEDIEVLSEDINVQIVKENIQKGWSISLFLSLSIYIMNAISLKCVFF